MPELVASLLKSLLHTEERFLCIALSSSPVLSLGIAHERGGAMAEMMMMFIILYSLETKARRGDGEHGFGQRDVGLY